MKQSRFPLIPPYSIRFLVCILYFFFFAGCADEERFKATTTIDQFQQMQVTEQNNSSQTTSFDVMPPEIDSTVANGDYLLGPGDLIAVKVFESEALNTEVRVSSRGAINVPLIGDVMVMNMTTAEAEQLIEGLYKKDYIHDPHVAIYIKEHLSKQITLVGAVVDPGTYDYVSRKKLLDVLAIGQGLTDKAGSLAYITRKEYKTGEMVNYAVNLDELVKNGNMALNYTIQGGDVIFIPESGQCFIDGAVRKPGTYPLRSNMTITEAIAIAGGLAGYADDDSIKLIRYMGRGKQRQIVSLSYNDLQGGVGATLILKDQDIIFAESSATGKLFSGAGFTLGFMGTGVSFKNPEK